MNKEEIIKIFEKGKKYSLIWRGIYGNYHDFSGIFSRFNDIEFIFIDDEGDEETFLPREIKEVKEIVE